MLEICDNTQCTGCGACVSVCPKGAVSLKAGKLGALCSSIDTDKCIDCGLCAKECPTGAIINMRAKRKPAAPAAPATEA